MGKKGKGRKKKRGREKKKIGGETKYEERMGEEGEREKRG